MTSIHRYICCYPRYSDMYHIDITKSEDDDTYINTIKHRPRSNSVHVHVKRYISMNDITPTDIIMMETPSSDRDAI